MDSSPQNRRSYSRSSAMSEVLMRFSPAGRPERPRVIVNHVEATLQRCQAVAQILRANSPARSLNHQKRAFPCHLVPELDSSEFGIVLTAGEFFVGLGR